jgi:hypothetical protein
MFHGKGLTVHLTSAEKHEGLEGSRMTAVSPSYSGFSANDLELIVKNPSISMEISRAQ